MMVGNTERKGAVRESTNPSLSLFCSRYSMFDTALTEISFLFKADLDGILSESGEEAPSARI